MTVPAGGPAGRVSSALAVLVAAALVTAVAGGFVLRLRPEAIAPPERPRRVVPVLQREGDGSERLAVSPDGKRLIPTDSKGWSDLKE